jgi:hypothetical protein
MGQFNNNRAHQNSLKPSTKKKNVVRAPNVPKTGRAAKAALVAKTMKPPHKPLGLAATVRSSHKGRRLKDGLSLLKVPSGCADIINTGAKWKADEVLDNPSLPLSPSLKHSYRIANSIL